jgi:hypothetical protein
VINIRKRREIFVYYCRPRMVDFPLRFTQLTSKENFYYILTLTVLPVLLPLRVPREGWERVLPKPIPLVLGMQSVQRVKKPTTNHDDFDKKFKLPTM